MPEAFASALLVVFSVIYLLCPREATAQEGQQPQASEKPPEYQKLRYDEDYSYLKDPSKRSDLWDPIKYIPGSNLPTAWSKRGASKRTPDIPGEHSVIP